MIYTPSKSSEFFRDDIPRPPAGGGGVGSAVPTSINCPIPIRSPYPEVPSSSHHHYHEKLSSSCNHASTRRRRQQRERNNGKVSRRATYDSSAPKKKIGNSSCGNNNGRRGEDVSAIMLGLMSVEKKSAKADVYRSEQRNPVKLTGYRHMKRRHSNDGCHVELFHHPAERRSSLCSHMSSASSNHHHHHNNSNKDKDSEDDDDDDESKDKVNNNDESKDDDNNDTESLEGGGGSSCCGAAGFSMEKRESAKMFVRTRQADLLEANALGISAPALLTRKRKSLVEGVDASDDFDDQDNDSFNNDSISDAMSMSTSMSVRSTRSATRRLNDNSQSIRSARSNRSGPSSSSMAASRRGGNGNRRVMRSLSFDDSTRDIYQTSTRGGRRHNNMKNTAADFNRGVKKNNSGGGLMNAFANFRNRKFGFS